MRITNGMLSSQYMRNLNTSLGRLNYFEQRATNYRSFNRVSEDPARAAKAFSLRRSYLQNDDYKNNISDTNDYLKTADSTLQNLIKITTEAGSGDCLQAVNGTMTSQERNAIAAKLRKMQETIVAAGNTQYGDRYIFGGTTTSEAPFTVDANGQLFYKGVNVDTGEHKGADGVGSKAHFNGALVDFGNENGAMFNGYTLNVKEPKVPVDPTEINSIDPNNKTINIFLAKGDATNAGLTTALQTTVDDYVAANPQTQGSPFFNVDSTKFNVTGGIVGLPLQGTSETSGGKNEIKGSKMSQGANTDVGGLSFNFGSVNGDLLNSSNVTITKGAASNGIAIDATGNITFTLKDDATSADVETLLKGLGKKTVNGKDVDFSKSSVRLTDPANTAISAGTGNVTGGAFGSVGTTVDLDKLANEQMFIDLGLGLEFNDKTGFNKQSAFDISLPGISFLGYGKNDDGTSRNLYSLMGEIATKLESTDFNFEDTMTSINAFNSQQKNLITRETQIGAKQNFITFSQTRIEDAELNLTEKLTNTEQVKPDKAIMDFKMANFTYMAALQMGAKIIQPSFLDYMR